MKTGEKIKEIRLKKGISQKELAKRSGIHEMLISRYELGKIKSPKIDTVIKIANALNVNVEEIMDDRPIKIEEREINLKEIIDFYGVEEQERQAMEECSELIKAINKYHRKPSKESRDNIAEEIADMKLMIAQLIVMYDLSESKIESQKMWKMERTFFRMKEKKEKKE